MNSLELACITPYGSGEVDQVEQLVATHDCDIHDRLVGGLPTELQAGGGLRRHPAQLARLREWGATRSVDAWCRVLFGFTGGSSTPAEAVALCRRAAADGTTCLIATPRQAGPSIGNGTTERIRDATERLNEAVRAAGVPVRVFPGALAEVDERLAWLVEADEVLTSGDHRRHLMVELPAAVFVRPGGLATDLRSIGVRILLTGPECHPHLSRHLDDLWPWLEAGAAVQVRAGSLGGEWGRVAAEAAWTWVRHGLVHVVASDAQDARLSPPNMTEAIGLLCHQVGRDMTWRLCVENPRRLVSGEPLLDPLPLP